MGLVVGLTATFSKPGTLTTIGRSPVGSAAKLPSSLVRISAALTTIAAPATGLRSGSSTRPVTGFDHVGLIAGTAGTTGGTVRAAGVAPGDAGAAGAGAVAAVASAATANPMGRTGAASCIAGARGGAVLRYPTIVARPSTTRVQPARRILRVVICASTIRGEFRADQEICCTSSLEERQTHVRGFPRSCTAA